MEAISPTRLAALDHPRARWSMSASASTGEAVAVAGAPPLPSGPADVAVEESQASIIVKKRTSSRRSSSAPPEESSSARLVRQLDMNDLLREDDDAAADSPSLDSQDQAGQAAAAGQPQDSKASAKPASAANDKTQRRRSTRTAKDKQRKDASDSGVNEDEEGVLFLPSPLSSFEVVKILISLHWLNYFIAYREAATTAHYHSSIHHLTTHYNGDISSTTAPNYVANSD